jgi:hypothetical protein
LPVAQILEFREKYEAEIERLRSGIGEIAVGIDVSQSGVTALGGGLAGVLVAGLAGAIERQKLLHASQWAVLLRFDELNT